MIYDLKKFLILLCYFPLSVFAQGIFEDRSLIEQFLNDDFFKQFHERFQKLQKDLDKGQGKRLKKFFGEEGFFDNPNLFQSFPSGESKWIETPDEKILMLKLKTQKDSPVDIKIKDGTITIKAEIINIVERQGMKSKSVSSYRRVFSIPPNVDKKAAKIEKNEKGEILIKFPKDNASTNPPDSEVDENSSKEPISPNEGDIKL